MKPLHLVHTIRQRYKDISFFTKYLLYKHSETNIEFEKNLFFIGFPRSGHSFVSKLIEANKNVLLTNEANYFRLKRIFNFSNKQLCSIVYDRYMSMKGNNKAGGNYEFTMEGTGQGEIEDLKYLGDKKASGTLNELRRDINIFDSLDKDFILINVVRNPFDNIATIYNRSQEWKPFKQNKEEQLGKAIKYYVEDIELLNKTIEKYGDKIITVRHEDFIDKPDITIFNLYRDLGLNLTTKDLEEFKKKTFKKSNKSRFSVNWDSNQYEAVMKVINETSFLNGYTFKN